MSDGAYTQHHIPDDINVCLLGVREKLIESVLVVIQTGHGHQETLNDLPGLASVVRLSVGTLQTVESRLDRLERNTHKSYIYFTFMNRTPSL